MPTVVEPRLGVCSECQSAAQVYLHSDSFGARDWVLDTHRVANREVGEFCRGAGSPPEIMIRTPYQRVIDVIDAFTDEQLKVVWSSLGKVNWTNDEMHDPQAGVSMNDWAEMIDSEMDRRGLPKSI